jgi:hypothetical protein
MDLPVYIKDDFANFYRALFDHQVEKEDMRAVFLEYAWNMNQGCDPCAASPPSEQELRELGVFWNQPESGSPVDTFITRLHLRYNAKNFPEDLIFQETRDRNNFQGRYVLRYPWQGTEDCPQAQKYRRNLTMRWEEEAQELANLTGWNIQNIRRKMNLPGLGNTGYQGKWWQKIWKE